MNNDEQRIYGYRVYFQHEGQFYNLMGTGNELPDYDTAATIVKAAHNRHEYWDTTFYIAPVYRYGAGPQDEWVAVESPHAIREAKRIAALDRQRGLFPSRDT